MAKLFVYYSYTGNGRLVAERFEKAGYDIRVVERKKKLPKSFFLGMMSGGFLASIKHKDELLNFDSNIEGYEEIVIGSPIWNGRFASPTNTVLASLNLKDKIVKFVLYSGSGEAKKAIKRIDKEYPEAEVIILKEPKKYPDGLKALDLFAGLTQEEKDPSDE